jgi:hypothetical protein
LRQRVRELGVQQFVADTAECLGGCPAVDLLSPAIPEHNGSAAELADQDRRSGEFDELSLGA